MKKMVKELRTEQRLSQKELSKKADIPYQTLVAYDNMYRVPPVDKGIKIAKALKTTAENIIWTKED